MQFTTFKSILKYSFYFLIFVFLCYVFFVWKWMVFSFVHSTDNYIGVIFTICNSLLLGLFMLLMGIDYGNKYSKWFMLMFAVMCIMLSVAYFGLRIEFRLYKLDFVWHALQVPRPLVYRYIQTNDYHGIMFVTKNWAIILIVVFITFFTESEV